MDIDYPTIETINAGNSIADYVSLLDKIDDRLVKFARASAQGAPNFDQAYGAFAGYMHSLTTFLKTTDRSNPGFEVIKAFIAAYAERVIELTPEIPEE